MTRLKRITVTQAIFACLLLVVAAKVGTTQTPAPPQTSPNVLADAEAGALFAAAGYSASGPAVQLGAAGDMIGFSRADASGTQTITLVHTGKSWMAVYHIDRSGSIRLVSSRPVDADFSLQLNATSPLPDEIRKMGKTR